MEKEYEVLEFKKIALEYYYNADYEVKDNKLKILKCDFGIDTRKSHKKYDFYRICRIVGGMILNFNKKKKIYSSTLWKNLSDKLELQYPYHDGWYYSLVSDYKANPIGIMTDEDVFDEPIDVAYYLHNVLYKEEQQEQYGGQGVDEKIENKVIEIKEQMKKLETIDKIDKLKNVSNKLDKKALKLDKLKSNLQNEKVKYDFMKIDYKDINTGSFNINN